jgi:plastocyanin
MSRVSLLLAIIACGLAISAKPKETPKEDKSQGTTHKIDIKDLKFSPANLDIKVGDTVEWTNSDDRDHTVVADDESFKSDNLSNGQTFKFTFKSKGKFKYSCSYHPRMKGTITVSE